MASYCIDANYVRNFLALGASGRRQPQKVDILATTRSKAGALVRPRLLGNSHVGGAAQCFRLIPDYHPDDILPSLLAVFDRLDIAWASHVRLSGLHELRPVPSTR